MSDLKPIEPPQHPWIFNTRQPDGTFKPLSMFFDKREPTLDEVLDAMQAERQAKLAEMEAEHAEYLDDVLTRNFNHPI